MPTETGIYTLEEATHGHDFSYRLAQYIGEYLPKNEPVIDAGCGPATYLRYLHDIGFKKLIGIEGTKQNFEFGNILQWDLTEKTKYLSPGNVICLEVGEHIPGQFIHTFIDNIASYVSTGGKLILSWAIPGQDGIGHVSCMHNISVVNEFQTRGFTLLMQDSLNARYIIENRLSYFRNTLMIFQKK